MSLKGKVTLVTGSTSGIGLGASAVLMRDPTDLPDTWYQVVWPRDVDVEGVVAFLRDFLAQDHGLQRIGITGYPDGHALIKPAVVHEALHQKQALLAEAGVPGWVSTQMHFDTKQWIQWLRDERAAGLTLPVHIGAAGAIDRMKLISLSTKLDIGSSVRFLKKNSGAISRAQVSPIPSTNQPRFISQNSSGGL